ncbi:low molecular weight phosphatase family protein [Microbacterium sp. NPDC076895]|uniref:arsenate reductase/protein-tyrosine-phosphatase family protein n=1 Tax=Microbacterium sp. NPDC076895 TaxID=3154957 RepID=UPI00341A09ED
MVATEIWGSMVEVLVVCTANMIRSPLAELYLREKFADRPITVRSAGTHPAPDDGMTRRARDAAKALGLSMTDAEAHRPQLLTREMVEQADIILGASRIHRSACVRMDLSALGRAFTIREFARLSAQVDDEALQRAVDRAGDDPNARVRAATDLVREVRGTTDPPGDPTVDDVFDPELSRRRSHYARMVSEMIPALDMAVAYATRVREASLVR